MNVIELELALESLRGNGCDGSEQVSMAMTGSSIVSTVHLDVDIDKEGNRQSRVVLR